MERTDAPIRERDAEIAGLELRWFEATTTPPRSPVLYLHGVPNSGEMWRPFLERTGGVAPDLPGFGRSGKPADFDYSIEGYCRYLEAFVDRLGLERFSLVVHDWGGVGLALAQRTPERVERIVVSNCVPFLPGYRWHRLARIWRTPVLGELSMGFSTRWGFRHLTRGETTTRQGPMPEEFIDAVWAHFDHGTQRAILKLYRSAPEDALARAGSRLGEISCPAMVLWGGEDRYLPSRFAELYAQALGGPVRLEVADVAGHWPWIDRPELIDLVVEFLPGPDG